MQLTTPEEQDLRTILIFIFGSKAEKWNMNEKVLKLTAELLQQANSCSEAINYVPRPTAVPDLKYFRRQLRDMARRARNHDKIYSICKSALDYTRVRDFQIASQGL